MDQAVDAKHCLVQSRETDKVCTGAETEQTDQKKYEKKPIKNIQKPYI